MTENNLAVLIVTDPITAEIYKGLLESNDIPVLIRSDVTQLVHPVSLEVEVLVSEDQLAEAAALIDSVEIIIEDECESGEDCDDAEPTEDR